MPFRLPKPDMSSGDFVLEVVIVVLGVLLAIGGEQILEQVRWHYKVTDATKQLDAEVHANARSAYRWLTVHPCLDEQLAAIEKDVRTARQTHVLTPVRPYTPPLEIFSNDAWLNIRSLQVADHIKPEAMRNYAVLYFSPPEIQAEVVQLHQLAGELQPLVKGDTEVSSLEAGEYERLIGKIRELQERAESAQRLLLHDGDRLEAPLSTREEMQLLKESRESVGNCATAPDLSRAAP